MALQLKKGGDSRYVITKVGRTDYFTIPKGHRIKYIYVETIATMTGTNNMAVGESEAVVESAYFDVSSVASATAGTITVAGVSVTLSASDILTTTAVAAKIAASAITGWTVTSSTNRVYFTATAEGDKTNVTVSLGTATNITFSAVTTTAGTLPAEVVASTTLTNTAGGIVQLTLVASKDIVTPSSDKKFYMNFDTALSYGNVNVYVGYCKFN